MDFEPGAIVPMPSPTRTKNHAFGIVILKDWMPNPFNAQSVNQIAGPLELITAKEAFGFQPKGNETNWGVRVGDETAGILILGCQIRAVYWGAELPLTDSRTTVMDFRSRAALVP